MKKLNVLIILVIFLSACTFQKVVVLGKQDKSEEFKHSDFDKAIDNKKPDLDQQKKSGFYMQEPSERAECIKSSLSPFSTSNDVSCK